MSLSGKMKRERCGMADTDGRVSMAAQAVAALFTRSDGTYHFARWGRPMSPVVFGVEDETLGVIRAAFQAVCAVAGQDMAETDPELGANVLVFFCREWSELIEVPDLDRLVDGLHPLVGRLQAEDANQYRVFRFDPDGAIRACIILLRMNETLSDIPAETLALGQAVQSIVLWSDTAFSVQSPLAQLADGRIILRPEIAAVLRATYDPNMPTMAQDPSHALRLSARLAVAG